MKGDQVPDLDHVSRFCRPATINEGIATGLAFRLVIADMLAEIVQETFSAEAD